MDTLFLILDNGNILVLSNIVHQTGAGTGEQHPVIFRAGLDFVACPISLDLETEVMSGRQRLSRIVASVYLKKSLTASSPIKFQLKHADSSKKTNVQVKQID